MERQYNDKVVRQFAVMTVIWGIVGMLVGVIIAAQLAWPALNFDIPWLSYGRLRPLHTNAVIFAFGGSALFATSYYVVQRTSHTRLFSDGLAAFSFWGWQAGSSFISILDHSEMGGNAKDPGRVMFNFETAQVREEFERIKDFGGTVIREPYQMGGGWIATLADPDGNYFQLVTPMG